MNIQLIKFMEMMMGLKIRFGGIVILLFMAIFFDFREMNFRWEMVGGVCKEIYLDQKR